jgi:hypothetical protein
VSSIHRWFGAPWFAGALAGMYALGCTRDVCSGLVAGDALEIRIDGPAPPNGATPTECDSRLGLEVGAKLEATVAEGGPGGCGTAIGPLELPFSAFEARFNIERSRNGRFYTFVSANDTSGEGCTGELDFRLYNVEPEELRDVATGTMGVLYRPGLNEPSSCPAACDTGYLVTLKRVE